ncbi:hypothetical protein [Flavobacterium suaedae]|uniref:hypothetical protein n=1 Tax=Flavobacterium suaedae TaxID=1767027 RepID=UPI001E5CD2FC|nr:hypothetical protein [Flavobacterium suaedae]
MLISVFAYSQERENATLPTINPIAKGKITEATGWLQNDDGEWLSRKNRLPWNLSGQDKKLIDYQHYALGENRENFTYIGLHDVTIDDVNYTILIKKGKEGHYKYESISKGWIPQDVIVYYVFESQELEKLKNLEGDKNHEIKIKTIYANRIDFLTPSSSLDVNVVEKDLYKFMKKGSKFLMPELVVYLKLYKDKARFVVQSYESIEFLRPDLDKMYYETTKEKFSKLFTLE